VAGFVNSSVGREVNGTSSGSCPVAGFGNSDVGREGNGTGSESCLVSRSSGKNLPKFLQML